MANGDFSAVLRHVKTLFNGGGGASDARLLEQFREGGRGPEAEAAFETLVARHGPMVLGVCRRALPDPNDAADAFQATFLVLVRKAGSVRVDDSLGRWLYGVSRKVAARLRADSARRRSREVSVIETAGPEDGDVEERREALAALDEEVARLPEPFRSAVMLCDLEGLGHEEAARRLGCPVGTVESRLSRGRKRLRERLARRGFSPTAAGLLPLAPPALPESLSASTVATATRATSASASVSALIERVITDMAITKIKTIAATLGLLTLTCGLAVVAVQRLRAQEGPKPIPAKANPEVALKPPAKLRPGNFLVVELLEALPGRPLVGERLIRRDGTISLGFYGDLKVAGLDRNEVKRALIEHMKRFLSEEDLGLVKIGPSGDTIKVPPGESDRVLVDDSLVYEPNAANLGSELSERPRMIEPGDRLRLEVLEALPGRPITGVRLVRPDGTVSLGFYGDLPVAGLDRRQVKLKLIEHLRGYISDQALGLVGYHPFDEKLDAPDSEGRTFAIPPEKSDRVYVDESESLASDDFAKRSEAQLKNKFDRMAERDRLMEAASKGRDEPRPTRQPRPDDHELRLRAIEVKLDRLIRSLEGGKAEEKRSPSVPRPLNGTEGEKRRSPFDLDPNHRPGEGATPGNRASPFELDRPRP